MFIGERWRTAFSRSEDERHASRPHHSPRSGERDDLRRIFHYKLRDTNESRSRNHRNHVKLRPFGCATQDGAGDPIRTLLTRRDQEHERLSYRVPGNDGRATPPATREGPERPQTRHHRPQSDVRYLWRKPTGVSWTLWSHRAGGPGVPRR